jgi:hypothetical protein
MRGRDESGHKCLVQRYITLTNISPLLVRSKLSHQLDDGNHMSYSYRNRSLIDETVDTTKAETKYQFELSITKKTLTDVRYCQSPRPNWVLRMVCLQAAWEIDLSTRGGTDFKVQLCHYRNLSRRQGQNLGITNSRLESRYRAPCLSA